MAQLTFSTSGALPSKGGFKYHPIHKYPPSTSPAFASPAFHPHPQPPSLISNSWIGPPNAPTTLLPPAPALAPPPLSHFPPPPNYPTNGGTPCFPPPQPLHQIPVSIHAEMNIHAYELCGELTTEETIGCPSSSPPSSVATDISGAVSEEETQAYELCGELITEETIGCPSYSPPPSVASDISGAVSEEKETQAHVCGELTTEETFSCPSYSPPSSMATDIGRAVSEEKETRKRKRKRKNSRKATPKKKYHKAKKYSTDQERRNINTQRERIRMLSINEAFEELGEICHKYLQCEKVLTKLMILRHAMAVIGNLERLIKQHDQNPKATCLMNRDEEKSFQACCLCPLPSPPSQSHLQPPATFRAGI